MRPVLRREAGRPGLTAGTYFRLLLIGYFEGIHSERGIVADGGFAGAARVSRQPNPIDHLS
jgi:hypothetical protein